VLHPPVFTDDYVTDGPHDHVTLVNVSLAKGSETFWDLARAEPARKFLGILGAYGIQDVPQELPENVTIRDNTADARTIYRDTRVLLMPSSYESWGRCAVEAACSGIPTLASPTPGLLEALDSAGNFMHVAVSELPESGIAARLVPEQGPVELWQDALGRLDDADYYTQRSEAAKRRAASLEALVDTQLLELEARLADL
jgi:glycosyltransferase involved in cell wall biosynthesis